MSDYMEGSLSPAESKVVDLHLKSCTSCNELVVGMARVLEWGKAFPVYQAPASLPMRIMANTPYLNCAHCEERMSDYLEAALSTAERHDVDLHLQACPACSELLAGMREALTWGKTFPIHEAPVWLPARIIANTPHVARERWIDTIAVAWKWLASPRTAMGVFTATLVLGWLGNLAGISPDWTTVVRNPTAIYYEAQGAMNRAYDGAVRRYYRSPLVSEIRTRIEQLREIS